MIIIPLFILFLFYEAFVEAPWAFILIFLALCICPFIQITFDDDKKDEEIY